jgi:hypothetical protein
VLIDKGAEANLISESRALALGLLITKGQFMNLNGASASINMISICQKVRVDVFGIMFWFDFMVSTDPIPILLGRLWARKTRLHSRNCDNGT